jgi:hypothetical protein
MVGVLPHLRLSWHESDTHACGFPEYDFQREEAGSTSKGRATQIASLKQTRRGRNRGFGFAGREAKLQPDNENWKEGSLRGEPFPP